LAHIYVKVFYYHCQDGTGRGTEQSGWEKKVCLSRTQSLLELFLHKINKRIKALTGLLFNEAN
jgi:hypothetical protein